MANFLTNMAGLSCSNSWIASSVHDDLSRSKLRHVEPGILLELFLIPEPCLRPFFLFSGVHLSICNTPCNHMIFAYAFPKPLFTSRRCNQATTASNILPASIIAPANPNNPSNPDGSPSIAPAIGGPTSTLTPAKLKAVPIRVPSVRRSRVIAATAGGGTGMSAFFFFF